jgi:hypothetical protein
VLPLNEVVTTRDSAIGQQMCRCQEQHESNGLMKAIGGMRVIHGSYVDCVRKLAGSMNESPPQD